MNTNVSKAYRRRSPGHLRNGREALVGKEAPVYVSDGLCLCNLRISELDLKPFLRLSIHSNWASPPLLALLVLWPRHKRMATVNLWLIWNQLVADREANQYIGCLRIRPSSSLEFPRMRRHSVIQRPFLMMLVLPVLQLALLSLIGADATGEKSRINRYNYDKALFKVC